MDNILWFLCGMCAAWAIVWAIRPLIRRKRQRQRQGRRAAAKRVLKKHGLTPQLYLATVGESDPELRAAMDEYALSGYLITNKKAEVVGKLTPRVAKKPHLRLVVSNE